ncbi:zf-TFIIB domain-containing protein [Candidatus Jorgensenbacteria bacterium]|nr:zf-TFIIB domain-containing protein [Candidatus Jorgensenbacteria bacterium]
MCSDCKLEEEAQREKKKKCPADGTTMDKEVVEELIIDRCPKCDSVWLDKGELEKIVDALEDEASSGRMVGMMTGIALGSAMHHR